LIDSKCGCVAAAVLAGALFCAPAATHAQTRVDFQRDVRPILSENCFSCHGPDASARKANLRLDLHADTLTSRPNGAPIVPGKPEDSLLYKKIIDANPARRMPPLSSHKTLTDEQKAAVRRWIEQGAEWKQHWAFVAPVRPALPAVKDRKWARSPIDRFVLAKIEAAGMAPNPEAERRVLARRVSLDLTGLPPRPEDVSAFVADKSPDAYEKLVGTMLASPHYGEHRARYWLDAARYGDTNGLHYDNYRGGIWPYRDWVVRAFNGNLPFDRFAVEQLAGDLLPNPTLDQRIATGFVRNNTTTNENGIIEEEVRAQYVKDRADTAGTVFLGLTVGCATCHDHKFDPISQKDHYALEAFFNNTTERIMDNNRPDPPPIVVVPADRDRPRWLELDGLRKSMRARMAAAHQAANARFDGWIASAERGQSQDPLMKSELLAVSVDQDRVRVRRPGELARLPFETGVRSGEESPWTNGVRSMKFDGKSAMRVPGLELTGDEPFSMTAWVYLSKIALHPGQTGGSHALVIASQMTPGNPEAKPAVPAMGWIFEIDEGVARLRLVDGAGKVIRAQAPYHKPVKAGTWNHLTFTYDGGRTENGYAFYVNGTRLPIERGSYGAQDSTIAPELKESVKNTAPIAIGAAANGEKGLDGSVGEFRVFNRVISEDEARLAAAWPLIATAVPKDEAQLSTDDKGALKLYYLMRHDAGYQALLQEFTRASTEHRSIELRANTAMVLEERPDSKPAAHLLFRGMYDQPRELLEAATPSFLPPMAPDLPRNRLGLARWIVDRANPLFARVTVNRLWQELYGAGIVESADDFGAQAQPPSHPELLDWLAVEFRESGWDVKKLLTLIVTSATYRQSAAIPEEKLRIDPKNTLLARGPRFRLDGEVVRDSALAASGLLVTKLGGPPVRPYQPAGVWEVTSMVSSNTRNYTQDTGEALYRRSLYTLWKRQAPPASMDIFDGPTRELCVVRRERTNTPMQALVTMNDPQFVEAARALAENAVRASGQRRAGRPGLEIDVSAAIDFMTARVLARPFTPAERRIVLAAYEEFAAHYRANTDAAAQLLAVGESPADSKLPPHEVAALTMVANQIFSLDEALNK
jgi:mono/diheme cytochrome c family protein